MLSRALAVSCSRPSNVLSSFSIGRTSNRVPSSGEIPSWRTIITTAGTVTLGFNSTGILACEIKPAINTNAIIDNEARDRSTKVLSRLIILGCLLR